MRHTRPYYAQLALSREELGIMIQLAALRRTTVSELVREAIGFPPLAQSSDAPTQMRPEVRPGPPERNRTGGAAIGALDGER